MDVFQVVVALAVIVAAAGIAVRAAHEPVVLPEEAPPEPAPRRAEDAPAASALAPTIVSAPAEPQRMEVGVPVLNPDPDRLIQTAVMVPAADGRGGAVFRLVAWIVVTGALIGLSFLAAMRAVGALFG